MNNNDPKSSSIRRAIIYYLVGGYVIYTIAQLIAGYVKGESTTSSNTLIWALVLLIAGDIFVLAVATKHLIFALKYKDPESAEAPTEGTATENTDALAKGTATENTDAPAKESANDSTEAPEE